MADTYTPITYNAGAPPGINAASMNARETFLAALSTRGMGYANFNVAAVTLTGSTSGTASLYQFVSGTFKYVYVKLNNFRNGGGSNQTIALPVPFTNSFHLRTGDLGGITLKSGASAVSVGVITTLGGTGDGSTSSVTVVSRWSMGEGISGWDTLQFNASYPTARQGTLIVEGI